MPGIVALAIWSMTGTAQADPISTDCNTDPTPVSARPTCFKPNETVTGADPGSTFPFLIVEVSDRPDKTLEFGDPTVNMSFQASKEVASEFISAVWMNLDPAIDPDALVFAFNSATAGPPSTGVPGSIGLKGSGSDIEVVIDENNVSPAFGEAGRFDIEFQFPTAGGPGEKRLNSFDLVQIFVSCSLTADANCASFDEESFDFFSVPQNPGGDTFRICEHEQGIAEGEGSGKICGRRAPLAVPNPATLMLIGMGLAAVGYVGRRTWRK